MTSDFEFVLFSTDPDFVSAAVEAGIETIIVDWENIGKEGRQQGVDTQINYDTVEDLRRLRARTHARVICRINSYGAQSDDEIEAAIEAGANEILLPMARCVEEVEKLLGAVNERVGMGILIETVAATERVWEFARLPLSRVYVGLNDLAIERKTPNIFSSLIDGTLERVREPFEVPFGFGGLTLPDKGFPIPCRLLIGEMVRLRCSFSFLRRSFHRDIQGRDLRVEVPRLRKAIELPRFRTAEAVTRDRIELEAAIRSWKQGVHGE